MYDPCASCLSSSLHGASGASSRHSSCGTPASSRTLSHTIGGNGGRSASLRRSWPTPSSWQSARTTTSGPGTAALPRTSRSQRWRSSKDETSAAAQTVRRRPTRASARASEVSRGGSSAFFDGPDPASDLERTPPKASPTSARGAPRPSDFRISPSWVCAKASIFSAFATSRRALSAAAASGVAASAAACPTRCRRRGAASAGRRGEQLPRAQHGAAVAHATEDGVERAAAPPAVGAAVGRRLRLGDRRLHRPSAVFSCATASAPPRPSGSAQPHEEPLKSSSSETSARRTSVHGGRRLRDGEQARAASGRRPRAARASTRGGRPSARAAAR